MSNYDSYLQYLQHVSDSTKEEFVSQLRNLAAEKDKALAESKKALKQLESEHKANIAELQRQHETELQGVKQMYESQIKDVESRHKAEITQQKKRFKGIQSDLEKKLSDTEIEHNQNVEEKDNSIVTLREELKHLTENQQPLVNKINAIKAERDSLIKDVADAKSKLNSLKQSHLVELATNKTQHQRELETIKTRHLQEIKQLKAANEKKLQEWNEQFELYKSEVADGVKALKTEIQQLNEQIKEKDEMLKEHSLGGLFNRLIHKKKIKDMDTPNFDTNSLFSDVTLKASVTLKADADCVVLCDGQELCKLKGNIPTQTHVAEGPHLFTFTHSKNKKAIVERQVKCTTKDNNILCITGLVEASHQHQFFFAKILGKTKSENVNLVETYLDEKLGILKVGLGETQVNQDLAVIQKKANQGIAVYQYILGRLYFEEMGVPRDFIEAEKWFEKANKQGYAHASCSLGILYRWAPKHYHNYSAEPYFKAAATKGLIRAQRDLGIMYWEGGKKFANEAKKWLEKSANQGDSIAQLFLDTIECSSPMQMSQQQQTRDRVNKAIKELCEMGLIYYWCNNIELGECGFRINRDMFAKL